MGKNQSQAELTNFVQYDTQGNIFFVSGSTTLMQISSSGTIITTGTITGSNALSSSFAISSSQASNASSLGNQPAAAYATTGSNAFNGAQSVIGNITATGQIIAQTLNVQAVTSSVVYSSGSNVFGNSTSNTQQMTGSVLITGSLSTTGAATFSTSVTAGGITASSWQSAYFIPFEIGNTNSRAYLYGRTDTTIEGGLGINAYYNSGWKYTNTGAANLLLIDGGWTFRNAASGTAGAALTWTDAMKITSSGNVGIGTTSPNSKLEVYGTSQSSPNTSNDIFKVNGSSTNAIVMGTLSGSPFATYIQSGGSNTYPLSLNPNGGNVGIGTSSPANLLDIGTPITNALYGFSLSYGNTAVGVYQVNNATGELKFGGTSAGYFPTFYAGASERMRITSAGQIYNSNAPAGDWGMRVFGNSTAGSSYGFKVLGGTNSSDDSMLVTNYSGGTAYLRIRGDGAFYTGAGSNSPMNATTGNAANVYIDNTDVGRLYRSTSSIKYKKDVIDYTRGLNEVMQLRPVFYKGISDNDGDKQFAGLIAEEVDELGLTEFVQYAEDGSPDALAYQNMVALAFKAIQEQNQLIEDLKSRLDKAGL